MTRRHEVVLLPALVGHCARHGDLARVGPVTRKVGVAVRESDPDSARKPGRIQQGVVAGGDALV